MNRLPTQRTLTSVICAISVVLSLLFQAHANYAYLPTVGAPAMRFQAVTTNYFDYLAFSLELAAGKLKPTATFSNAVNVAAAPGAETNGLATTSQSYSTTVTNGTPAGMRLDTSEEGQINGVPRFNFAFPTPAASDLLTVTPQMITQYLKPEPNETNRLDRPGAVVFVPADMPFMPPAPKNGPESRAIYQSQ